MCRFILEVPITTVVLVVVVVEYDDAKICYLNASSDDDVEKILSETKYDDNSTIFGRDDDDNTVH